MISMKNSKIKVIYIVEALIILFLIIGIMGLKIKTDDEFIWNKNAKYNSEKMIWETDTIDVDIFVKTVDIKIPFADADFSGNPEMSIVDEHGYEFYKYSLNEDGKFFEVNEKCKNTDYICIKGISGVLNNISDSDIILNVCGYMYEPVNIVVRFALCVFVLFIGFIFFNMLNGKYINLLPEFKKTKGLIFSTDEPKIFEYAFWAILFIIPFISFMYNDTKAFIHYEVNFWGSIFEGGGIRYFYEYSYRMYCHYIENSIGGAYAADYEFPLYIVLGIWGFPLYFVCRIFGIEETSNIGTLIYGKMIFVPAMIFAAVLIYKICVNIGIDKIRSKWASFLFLTSALVMVEVGIAGQLDIIGIVFILFGLYFYQKQNRLLFIIFFMIAVSFKALPLFIFVPLLLLVEKNVFKIAYQTVITVGTSFFVKYLFPQGTIATSYRGDFADESVTALIGAKLPLYNNAVPLIIISIGVLCAFCYLKNMKNNDELNRYSVFIPALSAFFLFISFDSTPYWYVLMAPFTAILLVYNSVNYSKAILFETIGMLALILHQYSTCYWVYDTIWAKGMLLDKVLTLPDELLGMQKFAAYTDLDEYTHVLYAVFIVCYGTFLFKEAYY